MLKKILPPRLVLPLIKLLIPNICSSSFPNISEKRAGQTQCRRLPHEWGLGKGKTEANLPPAKSAERLLRTRDLVTQ